MGGLLNKPIAPLVEAKEQRHCTAKHPVYLTTALQTVNEAKDPNWRLALQSWVRSEHFASECAGQVDESWDANQRKDVDRVVAGLIDRHRGCLDRSSLRTLLVPPSGSAILRALLERCDLRSMSVVTSMRHWLHWLPFPLPGESSLIGKLIESWGTLHAEQNKRDGWHATADETHMLGFAIVMLNTDAHSPRVKNKMSESQFAAQLRGTAFSEMLAREIYRDVQTSPVLPPSDSPRCPCVSCEARRSRKLAALTFVLHDSADARKSSRRGDKTSLKDSPCAIVDSFKAQSHFEPRLAREIVQFL